VFAFLSFETRRRYVPIDIPITVTIPDDGMAALREALLGGSDPGPPAPVLPPGERSIDVEFPDEWVVVGDREDEAYQWPNVPLEHYDPFTVFEGRTSRGSIRLAIGRCRRAPVFGRDRLYLITFHITAGGKRPLCEFVEVDDYESTRELVAIIRGNGTGKRSMYPTGSNLPGAYRKLRIETYSDHIKWRGSYRQLAVVAHEADVDAMLNHTLIQAAFRFAIEPS
jgi:hypothetical protein